MQVYSLISSLKTHHPTLHFTAWPLDIQANTKHLYNICTMQCWTIVADVGPTLYKWYTHLLCLLGCSFVCHFNFNGEHTVLQPFWRIKLIVHIAISVLPCTHFHLKQVKHFRVKCLAEDTTSEQIFQDWEGLFLWKSCTKRGSKPHDRQRHRQSATL